MGWRRRYWTMAALRAAGPDRFRAARPGRNHRSAPSLERHALRARRFISASSSGTVFPPHTPEKYPPGVTYRAPHLAPIVGYAVGLARSAKLRTAGAALARAW